MIFRILKFFKTNFKNLPIKTLGKKLTFLITNLEGVDMEYYKTSLFRLMKPSNGGTLLVNHKGQHFVSRKVCINITRMIASISSEE